MIVVHQIMIEMCQKSQTQANMKLKIPEPSQNWLHSLNMTKEKS